MILYASLITLMIILSMKASATIKTPATSVCTYENSTICIDSVWC